MPQPPLATPEDAAGWGYDLPADTAAALLSRASVRIRRAARRPIAPPSTVTLELDIENRTVLLPVHPVVAVTDVQAVAGDGTQTALTGWRWDGEQLHMPCPWPAAVPWTRRALVTWTAGSDVASDGIKELTCHVANRLALTPAGMDVGIRERKVDDYSETYASEQIEAAGDLLPGEHAALAAELGTQKVWVSG